MVLIEIAKAILGNKVEKVSKTGPVITVDLKGGSKITIGQQKPVEKQFRDKPIIQIGKR